MVGLNMCDWTSCSSETFFAEYILRWITAPCHRKNRWHGDGAFERVFQSETNQYSRVTNPAIAFLITHISLRKFRTSSKDMKQAHNSLWKSRCITWAAPRTTMDPCLWGVCVFCCQVLSLSSDVAACMWQLSYRASCYIVSSQAERLYPLRPICGERRFI